MHDYIVNDALFQNSKIHSPWVKKFRHLGGGQYGKNVLNREKKYISLLQFIFKTKQILRSSLPKLCKNHDPESGGQTLRRGQYGNRVKIINVGVGEKSMAI